ncbi:hypothetical protein ACIRPK_11780 [Kitasatospora sp. NPDC101801]|uniref:hypothetical protein n=1 Tax=Kitasatospora sp. NPDC101801 TaxID=3364103 RepID=UPI0037F4573A
MSYELKALIASRELLDVVAAEVPVARVAGLEQKLALIPMTDLLFDTVTEHGGAIQPGFTSFPGGFGRRMAAWSKAGPIGYVEADFCGGEGTQHAAVWFDAQVVLGPLSSVTGQPFAVEGSPISQALRRVGAQHSHGQDEFEAVGLDRHRRLVDWCSG